MPRSTTSGFSDPDEYQAALHDLGSLSLFVTAPGEFHARLTQVSLRNLRLAVVEEDTSHVLDFLAVPAEEVLISFPLGDKPAPIWGGIRPRTGEFMTIGPGQRMHVRTEGPSRWGAVWFPAQDLDELFPCADWTRTYNPALCTTVAPASGGPSANLASPCCGYPVRRSSVEHHRR